MTYILLIILTITSPNQDSKEIELKIPYSNKEECIKASKQIDFSIKLPGKKITTNSKCILKDSKVDEDNLEVKIIYH